MTDFKELIKEELIPATGCTEPIAIAYASAKAREVLGSDPKKITANLSSNIIKNANSVTVPSTMGRKGIEISVVAGIYLGDPNRELEVLADVDK
ncbi:MAG: serine dehydratase subunit alpha family protein, partial [Anaerococcus prevotii]|nr:serine dehydratase subunit alpha family protein [Anaerococcus prevotii]